MRPGLNTGYAAQYLPGMRDAVEQGDEETARTYRDLLLDSLLRAAADRRGPPGRTLRQSRGCAARR